MSFCNYQKTFAIIGIIAIILPCFFLIAPRKAEAIVPVIDAPVGVSTAATAVATGITAGMTTSLQVKEYILDAVVTALAKTLLHSLTNSIVNWIKSGFQGNPLFITDFQGYLTDAADQATGAFMKEFLSPEVYNAICSPWRPQLRSALSRRYTYADRMRCTLSTVINNAANFSEALRSNGWQTWMSVSLNPQNDPHSALLMTLDEQSMRLAKALGGAQTESIFNQGFLSMKECEPGPENQFCDDWTGKCTCIKYRTTSPGKWISDQLSSATGIEFEEIALADEINEIISALISQLLSTVLQGTGGITGTELPEPPPPPEEYATLIISISGNGTVTKNPDEFVYTVDPPEIVELTATPYEGYAFTGWSGDLTGTTTPAAVLTDKTKYITATFNAIPPASASCPSPGTTGTVSWNAISGVTYYALRINDPSNDWNGLCDGGQLPGDICQNVSGTSFSFSSTPGVTYNWWLDSCNASGCNLATTLVGPNFTCSN